MSAGRKRDFGERELYLASWQPPLLIAAIAVAIVGGFYLGGPGLGMAVGALAATSIVVLAVRAAPRGPIVPAPLRDLRRHVLLVARSPLEDPGTIGQIARLCESPDPQAATSEVRLLVPTCAGFLDRWSCERRPTHAEAQRTSMLSLASMTKAGLAATACVGDQDVVLAVEDELRTFPATDVVLITDPTEAEAAEQIATELRTRLETDFLHLEVTPPPAVCGRDVQPERRGSNPRPPA